jgi:hypothetical protein
MHTNKCLSVLVICHESAMLNNCLLRGLVTARYIADNNLDIRKDQMML